MLLLAPSRQPLGIDPIRRLNPCTSYGTGQVSKWVMLLGSLGIEEGLDVPPISVSEKDTFLGPISFLTLQKGSPLTLQRTKKGSHLRESGGNSKRGPNLGLTLRVVSPK